MPAEFSSPFDEQVQVVTRFAGRLTEGLSSLNSKIPLMDIPEGRKSLDRRWYVASVRHSNIKVYDRLRD